MSSSVVSEVFATIEARPERGGPTLCPAQCPLCF